MPCLPLNLAKAHQFFLVVQHQATHVYVVTVVKNIFSE